jgi:hypothetical protein
MFRFVVVLAAPVIREAKGFFKGDDGLGESLHGDFKAAGDLTEADAIE